MRSPDMVEQRMYSGTNTVSLSRAGGSSSSEFRHFLNHVLCLITVHSSGEFHTFRLPVPDLWLDILQKMKAAGLNGVSLYTHMGLINPSRGVIDLDGFRALQPFFDACRDLGLWVVLRPGESTHTVSVAATVPHLSD